MGASAGRVPEGDSVRPVDPHLPEQVEVVREGLTMAFYVAICVFAALEAVSGENSPDNRMLLGLVWGTTVGLALAHWFAFRLSAQAVASGRWRHQDAVLALAQVLGAAAVALLVTIPIVVLPDDVHLGVARLVVVAFIGLAGYSVARRSGATRARALAYAAVVVLVASAIALIKNLLVGH